MDYPTLGPWVCDFIEERFVYGPGSMQGMPVVLDEDQKEILWYAYEHFPRGHTEYGEDRSGRRRFQRVAMSVRKGSAKCLAPNTLLITERGRVRADELRVGDSVLSHRDGKSLFRRVAAVEEQPVTAMYRVRTSSGREIETSIGHPFLTAGTQWRTGMPKRWKYTSCDPAAGTTAWSDVQDLASGDRIVVGLDWLPEGGDVDLGWLLGVLVGDACGDGRFSNSDVEISDRVRSHFDLTELPHVQDGQFYMRGSRDFLREHGLFGKNAYSKTTPPVVLSGGRDTALGYLAGLLDTDGSTILRQQGKKWTRVVEWYSVSKSLMEDVQHLLAGVGINGMLRACHSKYKGQDYLSWRVVVSDHAQVAELAEMLPVVRARNVENMRLFSETLDTKGKFADAKLDKVVSVERISDGVTIGVEIEDTHVHVTNGLVTHNTELLAWVVAAEIHPEAPVRFAGYDATLLGGMKSGRPVTNPYVPMLAYTKDQVSELGYGALQSILETCDDSHLFKITDKEIVRLNSAGRPDGKAVPLAGTPGALDGARTTMQALDETHRLHLPNHKAAIETMLNNLPKRPLEDPWQFSTTTAGEPGQDSYAEDEYREGMENWEGRKASKGFFFMHRQANDGAKFDTMENRIKAIREATGPGVLSWGSKQIIGIAEMWDREGADKQYLERVWANRWTQTDAQAFDRDQFAALGDPSLKIPDGAFITLGFDGAVRDDSTAIVATDIRTGVQNILGLWERPADLGNDEDGRPLDWRVPEQEVMDTFTDAFKRFEVWRLYADPPHWMELIGKLGGLYPDQVVEFWTKNLNQMYYAIKNYQIAVQNGDMAFDGDPDFVRHAGNAGKRMDRGVDEDNQPKFRLAKIEQKRKFDAVVAAILSWEARMDALAAGAEPEPKQYMPERVR